MALDNANSLNALIREPMRIHLNALGPLAEIPIVVKANIAIEGYPHCGASPALSDNIAHTNAPVVDRLLAAGAVIVGQANMHELAFGITSHNAHYGAVGNPAKPSHMAGGSSGGTAACVAGGLVPMGLASDTGGSGRLPAAMCGCVGFRPTHGRYPSGGVLTLSDTMDTVTPMAKDVNSLAVLDAVLAGNAIRELKERRTPDITLAVVEDPLWQGIDRNMDIACRRRLDLLHGAGVQTVLRNAPGLLDSVSKIAMGIVLYETQRWWSKFLGDMGATIDQLAAQLASPDVASIFQMMAAGAVPPENTYLNMVGAERDAVTSACDALLHEVDGLIMPTLPTTAPRVGDIETVEINGQSQQLFDVMTRRELVASICGAPSITLPAGTLDGLPIGMEIIGNRNKDRDLMEVASGIAGILACD